MREGPEHQQAWRERFEISGQHFSVEARHYTRSRLPRPHEIAKEQMRGRVWAPIKETEHQWAVVGMGRVICTLRQAPNGCFHSGHLPFPRKSITEAARAAILRHLPDLARTPDQSDPTDTDTDTDTDTQSMTP